MPKGNPEVRHEWAPRPSSGVLQGRHWDGCPACEAPSCILVGRTLFPSNKANTTHASPFPAHLDAGTPAGSLGGPQCRQERHLSWPGHTCVLQGELSAKAGVWLPLATVSSRTGTGEGRGRASGQTATFLPELPRACRVNLFGARVSLHTQSRLSASSSCCWPTAHARGHPSSEQRAQQAPCRRACFRGAWGGRFTGTILCASWP